MYFQKESTSADSVSGHDDSSGDNEIETDLQVVLQDSSQKLGNTRDPCIVCKTLQILRLAL